MLSVDEVKDGRVHGLGVSGTEIDIALDIGSLVEAVVNTFQWLGRPDAVTRFRISLERVLAPDSYVWKDGGEIVVGHASATTIDPQGRKRKKRKG